MSTGKTGRKTGPDSAHITSWRQRFRELTSAVVDGHGSRGPPQHHNKRCIGKAGHHDNKRHPDGPEGFRSPDSPTPKKLPEEEAVEAAATAKERAEKKAQSRKNAIKLVIAAIVTGVLGYFMTKNMESFSLNSGIPEMILYGIMEPVIGYLVEHLTAVTQGKAGKIDLAIATPLGSSIQILLGLIPLAVFFSMLLHAIHSPIPMLFLPYDPILNAILWISSVLVWTVSSDNRFEWPEGSLLVLFYIVFGAGMYAVPVKEKWYQGW
ncbi:hypothetical protein B0H14DRAFT_3149167 [Mycena olivaceomarginata]|nr:hypothetical protein B0H14DRAFT_3149167 [Mycena olivaceomarginata]